MIEGNAAPITAAMIGGMIPPLAIATAMLIFRRKFTKEQRGSIIPNYVMGMSFITEGAIPFAAADPLRVIPSMMIGSGIGGAIALGLGSRITAPRWYYRNCWYGWCTFTANTYCTCSRYISFSINLRFNQTQVN